MVNLYRRGRVWWVRYRHQGQRIQRSLETTHQRTAERKRRQVEYELETGQLQQATRTPLKPALSAFCQKLMATQTPKAWKNDLSYLRAFFGPACDELRPRDEARWQDPLAGRHVACPFLEQVTSAMISSFPSRPARSGSDLAQDSQQPTARFSIASSRTHLANMRTDHLILGSPILWLASSVSRCRPRRSAISRWTRSTSSSRPWQTIYACKR